MLWMKEAGFLTVEIASGPDVAIICGIFFDNFAAASGLMTLMSETDKEVCCNGFYSCC